MMRVCRWGENLNSSASNCLLYKEVAEAAVTSRYVPVAVAVAAPVAVTAKLPVGVMAMN